MMGRHILLSIILSLSVLLPAARAQGTGTVWSTLIGTDSSRADFYPEGFTGFVDPANPEQECKKWCLSIATCTMFLYYTDDTGTCYIKTGSPTNVIYQINDPELPYALVIRDLPCDVSLSLVRPFLEGTDVEPQCIETRGNTDDGEDEVPQGALNEPCLPENICLNGNVCDVLADGSNICKSPLNGDCRDISDCSYTTANPELECTLQGGTNDNRICAIVPRGDLNELCLTDNTCRNGNICDVNADGSTICKVPLSGVCLNVSDCSSTIADPDLECTMQGNSNSGVCAIVPRGDLNEQCFADNTCFNGNVCDTFEDGSTICKVRLRGVCSDVSDCSSTIGNPEFLECVPQAGTGTGICDRVIRGGWNQPCFADNTCSNGNICEVFQDGTTICKSPLYGLCFDISDCSSTLAGPDLECNKEGGSDSGYCAVIPRGALNEPCLLDSTCSDGNVCDVLTYGPPICKSSLNGFCSDLSDCSNTIADPDLACTLLGGTDGNRVCAIVAAAPPGASQVAQRRKRNTIKARMDAMLENQCPKRFIACPIQSGQNFECVNPLEELAHCGTCGNDCQEVPGVHKTGVSCSQGECLIYRCRKGFKRVGNQCIAKSRRAR